MPGSRKLAIVAAMEREVRPLIKTWPFNEQLFSGREFRCYESGDAVLVCGGIGADAARLATETIISLYRPNLVVSVGYAGALNATQRVGEVIMPSRVIDMHDGGITETHQGEGILLSVSNIAGVGQKATLAATYEASAVDMEAAAVACVARAHGLDFTAIKVISDEFDFALPAMDKFIDSNGQFRSVGFSFYAAVRPWLWPHVVQLARNSAKASSALCYKLAVFMAENARSGETTQAATLDSFAGLEHQTTIKRSMETIRK